MFLFFCFFCCLLWLTFLHIIRSRFTKSVGDCDAVLYSDIASLGKWKSIWHMHLFSLTVCSVICRRSHSLQTADLMSQAYNDRHNVLPWPRNTLIVKCLQRLKCYQEMLNAFVFLLLNLLNVILKLIHVFMRLTEVGICPFGGGRSLTFNQPASRHLLFTMRTALLWMT